MSDTERAPFQTRTSSTTPLNQVPIRSTPLLAAIVPLTLRELASTPSI
jgi:hypothetical protein